MEIENLTGSLGFSTPAFVEDGFSVVVPVLELPPLLPEHATSMANVVSRIPARVMNLVIVYPSFLKVVGFALKRFQTHYQYIGFASGVTMDCLCVGLSFF